MHVRAKPEESVALDLSESGTIDISIFPAPLNYPPGDKVLTYLREGWFEYAELAFISCALRPGDRFVDAGAHCGLYSALASQAMGDGGDIIVIEPNSDLHPYIQKNVPIDWWSSRRKRAKLVKGALATSNGVARLFVNGETAYATLTPGDADEFQESVAVETYRIETLIDEGAEGHTFIKLDLEGCEFDVIEASSGFFEQSQAITLIVEFDETSLKRNGRTSALLADRLRGLGFELYELDGLTLQLYDGRALWGGNLIATRSSDFLRERISNADASTHQRALRFIDRGRAAGAAYESSLAAANELAGVRSALSSFVTNSVAALTGDMQAGSGAAARIASTSNLVSTAQDELGRIAGAAHHVASEIDELKRAASENERLRALHERLTEEVAATSQKLSTARQSLAEVRSTAESLEAQRLIRIAVAMSVQAKQYLDRIKELGATDVANS